MDPDCLGEWVTIHRKLLRADAGSLRVGYTMEQRIQVRGVSLEVHWTLVGLPAGRAGGVGRSWTSTLARTHRIHPQRGGRRHAL